VASLKGDAQGGSTITQQLARNMFPEEIGRSRNLNRKLKEMITAIKIENTYSKTEILEAYLNTVPFLYNTFGIEMAARTYFDKPAANSTSWKRPPWSACSRGPITTIPVTNPERSLERRNVVLGQMVKHGLQRGALQGSWPRPLRVHFARQAERSGTDTHFTAYVRKWLIEWADENDYNLELDGLVVHTTLDYDLQAAALRAVERQARRCRRWPTSNGPAAGHSASTSTGTTPAMRGSVRPSIISGSRTARWLDAFVRESGEYRARSRAAKRRPRRSSASRPTATSCAQLRSARRAWKPASSRWTRPAAKCGPGSAAAISSATSSTTWPRPRASPAPPSSRSCTARRWKKASRPSSPMRRGGEIKAGDGTRLAPDRHDRHHRRQMTMRDGLVFSKNTITAQVMQDVGLPRSSTWPRRPGHPPEQAGRGAVAGAGHQPGDPAGNGQRLRHHRRAGRIPQAGVRHAASPTATARCRRIRRAPERRCRRSRP
jgi:penicillin-binding protein 1A